ncbi:MAG: M20 family metallopeptidase [Bacteroidota bacterium]|nr:M20 family metallopeptidase [Bacteroidota bacterium]
MNQLHNDIKEMAAKIWPELVQIRRHLHQHPELSFEEVNTSQFVKSILNKHQINFSEGWVKHGIVATLKGKNTNDLCVALRADMDALPIQEKNDLDYKSSVDGIMHACGHDVHMSCVLGAAIILESLKSLWEGEIKIIFQPGEEKLPGGANLMIEQGVLKNPKPDAILGLHVQPGMEPGHCGFCPGPSMASSDEIYITIEGKGGHAAMPDQVIDPILISAQIISSIQSVISRNRPPLIPSVLSFGKIRSDGGATNIIPDRVFIEGTFRSLDENWRVRGLKLIEEFIHKSSQAFGGKAEVKIIRGYPCLHNSIPLTEEMMKIAGDYLGPSNVTQISAKLSSEDFAWYSQQIPACFFRLGTGQSSGVHTATFQIDEKALEVGSGLMAWMAISLLSTHKNIL